RRDAADEEEVPQPVVQDGVEARTLDARADALEVDGDGKDARIGEAHRLQLAPVVLRVAQGDVRVSDERAQILAPRLGGAEHRRIVGREEVGRRHVVVLEDAPPRQGREGARHRGDQREREDGSAAGIRRWLRGGPHLVQQIPIDGHRKRIGLVAHSAQQVAYPPGRIPDRVAAVGSRHPLVDDHASPSPPASMSLTGAATGSAWKAAGRSLRSSSNSSDRLTCSQKSDDTGGRGRAGAWRIWSTNFRTRPPKSFFSSRSSATSWPATMRSERSRSVTTLSMSAAICSGSF